MQRVIYLTLMLGLLLPVSAVRAGEHVVQQKNKNFSAAELTLKPGDSIVFKNDDDVVHNVFANSKDFQFNLKLVSVNK
jgi:plastocyanin